MHVNGMTLIMPLAPFRTKSMALPMLSIASPSKESSM